MKRERTGNGRRRAAGAALVPRRGFALIELMITVAIVGILAAIAIPTYQDYIVKSQLSRAFWEASAYKIPVEERLQNGVSDFPDPVQSLGYVKSALTATANAFVFNADGSGSIVVTLDGDVHPAARNARLTVGRLADGSWNCSVRRGNDGLKPSYLPVSCALETGN